jgi:hypothetical protein
MTVFQAIALLLKILTEAVKKTGGAGWGRFGRYSPACDSEADLPATAQCNRD